MPNHKKEEREFSNTELSIIQKADYPLIQENIRKLHDECKFLGIDNFDVLETGILILRECYWQEKGDINVSKTGEGEILIYREREGRYSNLLIDNDADVQYMHIGTNPSEANNKEFFREDGLGFKEIVSLL